MLPFLDVVDGLRLAIEKQGAGSALSIFLLAEYLVEFGTLIIIFTRIHL